MGTGPPRKRLRVLHCPGLVGGHAQQLARSERELGVQSWAVAFEQSRYHYATDEVLWPESSGRLTRELKRWGLLWRALCRFDVVHFNFGATITPQLSQASEGCGWRRLLKHCYAGLLELRDLPLLKAAGKAVVVTFQGDDARQGDFIRRSADAHLASEVEPGYYSPESDSRKRWRIAQFSHHADHVYALNPDLLRVLPPHARFLPYAHIDLREWQPPPAARPTVPLVLHAPTHRGVKGTRFVLEAVERLKAEGVVFEFALVEGLSRDQARRLYERADLLIDQLLIGWYGGLAVELMALGKPVVCYLCPDDLHFIPEAMRQQLPVLQAGPSTLYRVLREWLTVRRDELPEVGRRSRAYVEKWHDPLTVAAGLIADYAAALAVGQVKRQT